MTEHAVVIAGGGPTGLMLAGELALAGVDVAVVERRPNQDLAGSRAGGLHARTIEVLDQRGIADRFLSQGLVFPVVHFHVPLDISDFPTRHNYVLGLRQNHIERILPEWVGELAVTIYRGREVTGFTQNDTDIDVALSDGESLRAEYLVGCDGGRSLIRKAAGIEFAGWDPTTSWLIAEVKVAEEPKWGFHEDALGRHAIGKGDGEFVGVVLTEAQVRLDGEPTLRDIADALIAVYGTDYGIHSPRWVLPVHSTRDTSRKPRLQNDHRIERVAAGDGGLGENVSRHRPAGVRAGEYSRGRKPCDVERVQREDIVMRQDVVPRRTRAVVPEVVACHVRVAREPARVVIGAVPRISRRMRSGFSARGDTFRELTALDRLRIRREIDQYPVKEIDPRQGSRHDPALLVDVVTARRHVRVMAQEGQRTGARGHCAPAEIGIAIGGEFHVRNGVHRAEREFRGNDSIVDKGGRRKLHGRILSSLSSEAAGSSRNTAALRCAPSKL